MFRLLLERFWPALIPFLLYFLWLAIRYALLQKRGEAPRFLEMVSRAPLFYATLASFLIIIISFLDLGLSSHQATEGRYVPPHQENGKIVPGHVEQ